MNETTRVLLADGQTIVRAEGPLDGTRALRLLGPARRALAMRPPRLRIDLLEVTAVDYATAQALARIAAHAAELGIDTEVVARPEDQGILASAELSAPER